MLVVDTDSNLNIYSHILHSDEPQIENVLRP
jgi:hypothetical protein